ncbi:hypothetical protein L6452_27242 [Arctium lappa]|uniref:Uncharacterized protein n=1 Tax=Arctium lappa TaxID=4217 RepID=A0ACB8ZV33_ARCLA|nr:hypothetical protein L6452_27242 [Arctium lappa]
MLGCVMAENGAPETVSIENFKPQTLQRWRFNCSESSLGKKRNYQDDVIQLDKELVFSLFRELQPYIGILRSLESGPQLDRVHLRKLVSLWISIPDLIGALSKLLPPKAMKEITQYRCSYIEHKISRRNLIQGIREFTGDSCCC